MTGIRLGVEPSGTLVRAPWAGSLVALGARLARYAAIRADSQLILALTVPVRDLAAVLVTCGWTLTRPQRASLATPADVVTSLVAPTPVRMLTDGAIVANRFFGTQPSSTGQRLHVGKSFWPLDRIRHLTAVPEMPERRFGRRAIAAPGSLAKKTGEAERWAVRQCEPVADVAILGTKSWLVQDMSACVGWGDTGLADRIGDVLLPDCGDDLTWATEIHSASLLQEVDLSAALRLVVLDGASAVRWLPAIDSRIVVAVIDRRAPDDSAAETVLQVRARSETLLSLSQLGWQPPPGVEALAFSVPL